MSTFSTVSELEPSKEICKINVQIIRMWKSCLADGKHTVELVLCDSMGDKIHASISEDLIARYEPRLKEGYWYIMEKFSLIISGGVYRTSRHAYMVQFGSNTRVRVCDLFPRPLSGFQPVAFRDILDGMVTTDYLVDVIGQIVGLSHLEIVSFNGKDTEKITLELLNQYDDRLTVHMWGKYAIVLSDALKYLNLQKSVICVMRFSKISVFKDRSVSTDYDVTDVSLNPQILEVEAFSKLLNKNVPHIALVASKPVCLIPEIFDKYRFFRTIPHKTLIEVLETKEIERCIVRCTVAAIAYDMEWYYMICKICFQKVLSVPRDKMIYGNHVNQVSNEYYCAKCNTYRPEILPRFNVQLVVLDNTGDTKFLLLDNLAEKLLGISCAALAGLVTDQIKEPAVVHSVLSKLVGETYFFKIGIEKANVLWNCQTFKILEIIPTSDIIKDFALYQQPRATPSTNFSNFLAWIDYRHQNNEADQLTFSEMPTRFIYDDQRKGWKKRSGKKRELLLL